MTIRSLTSCPISSTGLPWPECNTLLNQYYLCGWMMPFGVRVPAVSKCCHPWRWTRKTTLLINIMLHVAFYHLSSSLCSLLPTPWFNNLPWICAMIFYFMLPSVLIATNDINFYHLSNSSINMIYALNSIALSFNVPWIFYVSLGRVENM